MFSWQENALAKTGRKLALVQIAAMIVVALTCTLTAYFIGGETYAISAAAGAAAGVIPNCVFAIKAFRFSGAQASKKVMQSFNSGAKLKLGLSAFFCALAFKFLVIAPAPFFGSFCVVLVVPILTPIFYKI